MDLKDIVENFKDNSLKLSYTPSDKNFPAYQEDVSIQYMMQSNNYYIIENVKSTVLGNFMRVWTLKPIGLVRYKVTYLS